MNEFYYKTICILVTHNPEINHLKAVCRSININKSELIIIDNASKNYAEIRSSLPEANIIKQNENLGIAKAQNIGIENALRMGYHYLWFSDQDTLYEKDFLFLIFKHISDLEKEKIKFAAIGPAYTNAEDDYTYPFVRINKKFEYFNPKNQLCECSQLISSGTIMPQESILNIGYFRQDFFIDYVDLEWCWRAINKGYKIYGAGNIKIKHYLGDKTIKLFNRNIHIRSAFRIYHIIRNSTFIVFHTNLINFRCKLSIFIYELRCALLLCLASNQRIKLSKAILKGYLDGIFGNLSK